MSVCTVRVAQCMTPHARKARYPDGPLCDRTGDGAHLLAAGAFSMILVSVTLVSVTLVSVTLE